MRPMALTGVSGWISSPRAPRRPHSCADSGLVTFRPMPPYSGSPSPAARRNWARLFAANPAKAGRIAAASCIRRRTVSSPPGANITRGSSSSVLGRRASGTRPASASGKIRQPSACASGGIWSARSNRAASRGGPAGSRRGKSGRLTEKVSSGRGALRASSRASSARRRSSLAALPGRNQGPPCWATVQFSAAKGVPPVLRRLFSSAGAGSVRAAASGSPAGAATVTVCPSRSAAVSDAPSPRTVSERSTGTRLYSRRNSSRALGAAARVRAASSSVRTPNIRPSLRLVK